MAYARDGAGLHRFTDAADGETYLAVHAGLDNAQRVFAAFDQPDLARSAAPRSPTCSVCARRCSPGWPGKTPAGYGRWPDTG
jgi:hypothetical protein